MGDLTKWPRLLVAGEPVTREQANEILVRTDGWWLAVNDRDWERTVKGLAAEFGAPTEPPAYLDGEERGTRFGTYYRDFDAWKTSIGVLPLHYLHNSRIASSWIGGPHGWCDWNGTVGCANYNLGKWPTVAAVTDDWQVIAAAFPYLDLRAQLVPDEGEAGVAAVEWRVAAGRVEQVEPGALIAAPAELDTATIVRVVLAWSGRERGVSVDRLREALAQVTGR